MSNQKPVRKHELEELIKGFVEFYGLDKNMLTLTTSAALVVRGLKTEARDIDFEVESKYFEELVDKFSKLGFVHGRNFIINDDEGVEDNFYSEKIIVPFGTTTFELWGEYIDGQTSEEGLSIVKVATVESVVYLKARMGRPKDMVHIASVMKQLRK